MTDSEAARYAYLAEGNAKQARKRVAADVLLRDTAGQVLLVNPTYKDYGDLPGGMAEYNEPPRIAAERELREEVGLTITVGRVLVVNWDGPHGPWDDQLVFVFDAGTLTTAQAAGLRTTDDELAGFEFVPPADALRRLRSDMAERLTRALRAQIEGTTDYSERHHHSTRIKRSRDHGGTRTDVAVAFQRPTTPVFFRSWPPATSVIEGSQCFRDGLGTPIRCSSDAAPRNV
jgi:8-oxo-dGTP pyrophosphatase MutT (NUDIX family)